MLSRINSTVKAIWKKMRNKEYRDSFVAAHISNTISAQINTMRQIRGWNQSELATRCDMRQSRISALEDPDIENVEIATLRRVASAFDVGLSVRFVPFSEIAQRASNLNNSDFNVQEYSKDSLVEQKAHIAPLWNINIPMIGATSQINTEYLRGINKPANDEALDYNEIIRSPMSKEYIATVH